MWEGTSTLGQRLQALILTGQFSPTVYWISPFFDFVVYFANYGVKHRLSGDNLSPKLTKSVKF